MTINIDYIYKKLKLNATGYTEEIHCPMVLKCMDESGTVSAFCVEAMISDSTFYRWINKHVLFNDCYRIGCMIARENWENEGKEGRYEEDFNIEIWRIQGASRFGVGRTNRVRLQIDADASPFEQYKQLVSQATMGDFSAAEFKQLMETINIGCRAFESFELQKQVEEMKEDLEKMQSNYGNNIIPIKETA